MSRRNTLTSIVVVVGLVAIVGCSPNTTTAGIEAEHKATVLRVHRAVSNGNIDIMDSVLAPDYTRHCQAMPPEFQEIHGVGPFKAFLADFLKAVPDVNDSVEFIIAEGDMVAYVTTTTGTQTGAMGTLPPSGRPFKLSNIVIHRFEGNRIAETWVSWDNVAMLTQLGYFPPPAPGSDN